MNNPQTVGTSTEATKAPQPSDHVSYVWSSAAVCFDALMEVSKFNLEAQNDMAELKQATINNKLGAIISTAEATKDTYEDDANSLRCQAGESAVNMLTSLGSSIMSAKAAKNCGINEVQDRVNNLGDCEKALTGDLPPDGNAALMVGDGNSPEAIAARGRLADEYENSDAAQALHRALNKPDPSVDALAGMKVNEPLEGCNELTPRRLLEEANDRPEILKRIREKKLSAEKELNNKWNEMSSYSQKYQMSFQAFGHLGSGASKTAQGQIAVKKGEDSAKQQVSQAGQQMMSEVEKSQQDQFQQYSQQQQQIFNSISELVRTDARG